MSFVKILTSDAHKKILYGLRLNFSFLTNFLTEPLILPTRLTFSSDKLKIEVVGLIKKMFTDRKKTYI